MGDKLLSTDPGQEPKGLRVREEIPVCCGDEGPLAWTWHHTLSWASFHTKAPVELAAIRGFAPGTAIESSCVSRFAWESWNVMEWQSVVNGVACIGSLYSEKDVWIA